MAMTAMIAMIAMMMIMTKNIMIKIFFKTLFDIISNIWQTKNFKPYFLSVLVINILTCLWWLWAYNKYEPIYKSGVEVNATVIKKKISYKWDNKKYKIFKPLPKGVSSGDTIQIKLNPDKPKTVVFSKYKLNEYKYAISSLVFGIRFQITMVLLLFLFDRRVYALIKKIPGHAIIEIILLGILWFYLSIYQITMIGFCFLLALPFILCSLRFKPWQCFWFSPVVVIVGLLTDYVIYFFTSHSYIISFYSIRNNRSNIVNLGMCFIFGMIFLGGMGLLFHPLLIKYDKGERDTPWLEEEKEADDEDDDDIDEVYK